MCIYNIEQLIQYIQLKYIHKHITPPNFLLFELFRHDHIYLWQQKASKLSTNWKYDEKLCSINKELIINPNFTTWFTPPSILDYHDRGNIVAPLLFEFARFYRIPVISTRDAFYPSFIRFYSKHPLCTPWPFASSLAAAEVGDNGIDLHSNLGNHLLINIIVKEFFYDVIRQQYHTTVSDDIINESSYTLMNQDDGTALTYSLLPSIPSTNNIHDDSDNDIDRDRNDIILYNPIYNHLDIQFFPNDEEYQSYLTTTTTTNPLKELIIINLN